MAAVLEAEQKFELAELGGLEAARRAEHAAEGHVVGRRQRRQHVPGERHHRLDARHAREILVDLDQLVGADQVERELELVDDLLEPQFLGLVDDDEQQLVMMVGDRMLGREQRLQRQIVAVGHVVGLGHGAGVYHAGRVHQMSVSRVKRSVSMCVRKVRAMKRGIASPVLRGLCWSLGLLLVAGCGGGGGGGSQPPPSPTGRPPITSPATANAPENSAGTIYTATATDPDGNPLDLLAVRRRRPGRLRDHRRRRALLRPAARFRSAGRRRPEQCLSGPDRGQRRHDQRRARPRRHRHQCRPGRLPRRAASAPASAQPLYLTGIPGRSGPGVRGRARRAGSASSIPATGAIARDAVPRRHGPDRDRRRARPARLRARRPISPRPAPSTSS